MIATEIQELLSDQNMLIKISLISFIKPPFFKITGKPSHICMSNVFVWHLHITLDCVMFNQLNLNLVLGFLGKMVQFKFTLLQNKTLKFLNQSRTS